MMRCWLGYLSGVSCRLFVNFACGSADATAIISCLIKIQKGFASLVPACPCLLVKEAVEWVFFMCLLFMLRSIISWIFSVVYCLHLLSIVESLEVNLKTVSIQTQHITFRLPRSCCELFVRRSRHWRLTVRRWSSN